MIAEEVHHCNKCGLCLSTCPVFRETREESVSPRAKVQLIRHYAEEGLPTSPRLNDLVHRCLMCGSCTANCPSGVKHDALFMRMRAGMADDYGEDWVKRVIFHFLSHERQLHFASKFGALGRARVLENLVREVKIGAIPVKRLPRFNSRPFRDQMADVIEPRTPARGTVLYFTGCAANYIHEDVGRATVRVLAKMGFRVEIPKDQVCCGLPLFFHGAIEKTVKNVLINIALFNRSDIEAVVVDCATCGAALRKEYATVLKELDLNADAAENLAGKVKDISEFILENLESLTPYFKIKERETVVTYHAPCHLRTTRGVKIPAEQLIENLPGVAYAPASDFDSCCGGGGAFFYDHPAVSKRIVDKKIKSAAATGASLWATGCPGCRVNLSGNLDGSEKLEVLHPVQIVEMGIH